MSIAESKDFLQKLDELGDEFINKRTVLKIMLLTGVRTAEMLGLKWSDVDFKKKEICVFCRDIRKSAEDEDVVEGYTYAGRSRIRLETVLRLVQVGR